jgi:hypothetical protein
MSAHIALNITRSEAVRKGIDMVHRQPEKMKGSGAPPNKDLHRFPHSNTCPKASAA